VIGSEEHRDVQRVASVCSECATRLLDSEPLHADPGSVRLHCVGRGQMESRYFDADLLAVRRGSIDSLILKPHVVCD
jgi:hypothetical protein